VGPDKHPRRHRKSRQWRTSQRRSSDPAGS
jgi:hypothetical protein